MSVKEKLKDLNYKPEKEKQNKEQKGVKLHK